MSPRSYLKLLLRNNNPHYYAGHPHSRPASRMYVAYRSRNTKPEVKLRKELSRLGYRYRLNVKGLDGSSDIVLAKYRTCIFVNGCFWHGYKGCPIFVLHKTNVEFRLAKIENNRERDLRDYTFWESRGWRVIVVWECKLAKADFRHTVSEN